MAGIFKLIDPRNGNTQAVDKDGATLNIVKPLPPFAQTDTQKMRVFRQYLTNNGIDTGSNDMAIKVGTGSGSLGSATDHTGPTYTFTDVGGGFNNASAIRITSNGLLGNAQIGLYPIETVNSDTSVELFEDPTNGQDESAIAWEVVEEADFYVMADSEKDIYISTLSFVLTEPSMSLNEWGNIGNPLTNGIQLFYEDDEGIVDIHDSIKTNFDLIRLCLGQPAFGSGSTVFRASNVLGADEGYIPFLDLRQVFGFQWGVLLRAGTRQRLSIRIKDDISATDSFDCIAYGFTRSE